MNNYEKIKQMTVEQMANWLCSFTDCPCCDFYSPSDELGCMDRLIEWLLQEVEEFGIKEK